MRISIVTPGTVTELYTAFTIVYYRDRTVRGM